MPTPFRKNGLAQKEEDEEAMTTCRYDVKHHGNAFCLWVVNTPGDNLVNDGRLPWANVLTI